MGTLMEHGHRVPMPGLCPSGHLLERRNRLVPWSRPEGGTGQPIARNFLEGVCGRRGRVDVSDTQCLFKLGLQINKSFQYHHATLGAYLSGSIYCMWNAGLTLATGRREGRLQPPGLRLQEP